jgi:cytochrome c peroxidase
MQKKFALAILLFAGFIAFIPEWKNKKFKSQQAALSAYLPSYIKDSVYLFTGNEFSKEKATLGRYLFYDRRLSMNNTKACASCHAQEFSFTDGYHRSIGALGDLHQRNAKALINLVFEKYLTAADSTIHFPEQQIKNPMFSTHPVEMGWQGNEINILEKLKQDKQYQKFFSETFPEQKEPFTVDNVQHAISSFVKTIFSFSSPYDKYLNEQTPLNVSQLRGKDLFFSQNLACASCHGGINFNKAAGEANYFNTGLYNTGNTLHYPETDKGLYELTGHAADAGKYKTPTLRNLAFTAPYFHDGSATTLEEVIKIYENGGRTITSGVNSGDGRLHPNKSPFISGFKLNSQQRNDLISFLFSLSDSSLLTNPAYANPFIHDETK